MQHRAAATRYQLNVLRDEIAAELDTDPASLSFHDVDSHDYTNGRALADEVAAGILTPEALRRLGEAMAWNDDDADEVVKACLSAKLARRRGETERWAVALHRALHIADGRPEPSGPYQPRRYDRDMPHRMMRS